MQVTAQKATDNGRWLSWTFYKGSRDFRWENVSSWLKTFQKIWEIFITQNCRALNYHSSVNFLTEWKSLLGKIFDWLLNLLIFKKTVSAVCVAQVRSYVLCPYCDPNHNAYPNLDEVSYLDFYRLQYITCQFQLSNASFKFAAYSTYTFCVLANIKN